MGLKAGERIRDEAGTAEVIVVRAPSGESSFQFDRSGDGGLGQVDAQGANPMILLGKRYIDDETGTEILCTKGGPGALVLDGRLMRVKEAKPLPSSD